MLAVYLKSYRGHTQGFYMGFWSQLCFLENLRYDMLWRRAKLRLIPKSLIFEQACALCLSLSRVCLRLLEASPEITKDMQWRFKRGKAMATNSSTLAWKIPWAEEPGGLQSMGSRRVGHNWATSLSLFPFMHWRRKWQPTPVFLPGESQGRWSLVGCRPWGCTVTWLKRLSSSSSSYDTGYWIAFLDVWWFKNINKNNKGRKSKEKKPFLECAHEERIPLETFQGQSVICFFFEGNRSAKERTSCYHYMERHVPVSFQTRIKLLIWELEYKTLMSKHFFLCPSLTGMMPCTQLV